MIIEFGCQFTWPYLVFGFLGGLVALLTKPGAYLMAPYKERVKGRVRIHLGTAGRLIVAAIMGCVVDCNNRNAFFGGFFSWHMCRWLSEDGWNHLRTAAEMLFKGGK